MSGGGGISFFDSILKDQFTNISPKFTKEPLKTATIFSDSLKLKMKWQKVEITEHRFEL